MSERSNKKHLVPAVIVALGLLGGGFAIGHRITENEHSDGPTPATAAPASTPAAAEVGVGVDTTNEKSFPELLAYANELKEKAQNGGAHALVDLGKTYQATSKYDEARVITLTNPVFAPKFTDTASGSADKIVMVGYYELNGDTVPVIVNPDDYTLELVSGRQQDESPVEAHVLTFADDHFHTEVAGHDLIVATAIS